MSTLNGRANDIILRIWSSELEGCGGVNNILASRKRSGVVASHKIRNLENIQVRSSIIKDFQSLGFGNGSNDSMDLVRPRQKILADSASNISGGT
jgi:hypothetical protein